MRLWTLHPKYLDAAGLVALWREGLLAQKVLQDLTTGYRNHPQLIRFKEQPDPAGCISTYLQGIHDESVKRGYRFDHRKIAPHRVKIHIEETEGQLQYEWNHLLRKLKVRRLELYHRYIKIQKPEPHPLFRIVSGNIREWEKVPSPRTVPVNRRRIKQAEQNGDIGITFNDQLYQA